VPMTSRIAVVVAASVSVSETAGQMDEKLSKSGDPYSVSYPAFLMIAAAASLLR
jgi:hypothetical protein